MTDNFKNICGIIKAECSVSLEEMDEAIAQCAVERFNNTVESFRNPELIDEENSEWTAAMFSEAKTEAELFPHLIKPASSQKVIATIEYDADIISAFRAAGNNWQVRMNEALREWLQEHAL
jgi:uncharacterized protein (DUF4415 family)